MEDPELERIKQKKLQEMLKRQNESQGVIDLNQTNFDQIVSSEKPTLVDFWAEWYGPCKLMHPVFERLSKKYNQVTFGRVNVDQNQNISMKYQVQGIPTFIMFKGGKVVDKMVGAVGEPGITMIIQKYS